MVYPEDKLIAKLLSWTADTNTVQLYCNELSDESAKTASLRGVLFLNKIYITRGLWISRN